jgi:hypothetical protein
MNMQKNPQVQQAARRNLVCCTHEIEWGRGSICSSQFKIINYKNIFMEKEIVYFTRRYPLRTAIATHPQTGSAVVFNEKNKNGLSPRKIIFK